MTDQSSATYASTGATELNTPVATNPAPITTTPIIITASELRKSPGQFLDRVFYRGESFVVERAGKPMAMIRPVNREMEQLATTQSNSELGNHQSTDVLHG